MTNKEKIPSQFSIWLSPIYNINLKFINLDEEVKITWK